MEDKKQAVPIMPEIEPMTKLKILSEANGMTLLINPMGQVYRVNPKSQLLEPLGMNVVKKRE